MGVAVLDAVLTDQPKSVSPTDTEFVRLAQASLDQALRLPADTRRFWQQLVRLPPDVLHDHRERVRAALDEVLRSTRHTPEIVRLAGDLRGGPLPGAGDLPAARAELARFVESILTRWKSRDDLVQLMIDTIELPAWVTSDTTPEHLRPPQSWWDDEDDDPLQPRPADR
jgi:hypothetical protein